MRHRHLSNSFTTFGVDQQDNNHTPAEHSYFPTGRAENGPFVGQHQMNHMSRGHRSLEGGSSSRANEYPPPPPPSSNFSMEVQQPFVPPFSHPSITENRCFPHAHYTNYNHLPNTHDMESGPLNDHHHHPHPTLNGGGGGAGPLKRKRSGSLNSLYTVGSSSSSSQMPIEKPTLDHYRGNLTIDGQDSSRNVRRRYRHDDMESESSTSITRSHLPNHFYQSAPVVPVPVAHPPPPNYAPPVPHYPAPSHIREIGGGSRHEMNQFHVGGSSGDPVFSSRQNLHLHGNHHSHSRRIQSSYGNNGSRNSQSQSQSHYTHSSTNGNGLRTPPENFSSRNSRYCSPGPGGWRGNYSHRSGRPRLAVDRFHSVVLDVTESHDRIGHETLMMVDREYGNSRNFSDQYRDLRLDIDNMSYEELLNLEERIGSVNTGLSEDGMSKCLREKVYYSSSDQNQNHDEVSCPICLEEYKNGDNIGRMERCGHGYHVDCIKKWLLMKKLCPICKTECSH